MFSSVFDGPVVESVSGEMVCGAAGIPYVHAAAMGRGTKSKWVT